MSVGNYRKGPHSRSYVDGLFINNIYEENAEFKSCKILGTEVRVWGAEGGKGLSGELVSSLRAVVRKVRPEKPIALMADHHPAEIGVVGSVIATDSNVVPDLIGGDCGCGVYAACLHMALHEAPRDRLREVYRRIMERVPVGSAQNQIVEQRVYDLSIWSSLKASSFVSERDVRKLYHQLGSLGGGNHFIEIAKDEGDILWILVHSGSRYLGGLLRDCYQGKVITHPSDEGIEFLQRQSATLEFAKISRKEIATRVVECLSEVLECSPNVVDEIDQVHNYVSIEACRAQEVIVHRKGACRATSGELGIIPGSMRAGSYLVEGCGSAWSYNSSSHGAGRSMSRSDAFRKIPTKALFMDMQGIIWGESERLKDESPRAYKDIHTVLRAQRDLVRVRGHLSPLVVVKGES